MVAPEMYEPGGFAFEVELLGLVLGDRFEVLAQGGKEDGLLFAVRNDKARFEVFEKLHGVLGALEDEGRRRGRNRRFLR